MRLIDKLVLKDLIGPFLNGLLMFMLLVFTAASLFTATDMLVQGVPLLSVLKFILFSMPSVITQTFPMAMLLAGLLGFGRLSSDHEAVAIFAAGVSFPRAARVVVWMGVVVSVVAFFWNDWIVPPASAAMWDVRQEALQHIAKSDRPLAFPVLDKNGGVDEFVKVGGGYDAKNQTLRRVTIVKYSADPDHRDQPEVVIYCDRAKFIDQRGLNAKYYDGYFTVFAPDAKTGKLDDFIVQYFDELNTLPQGATIGKSFDSVLTAEITDPNRKSFSELRAEINADRDKGLDTRGNEVDLYGKIALPLASLIFGVVGAALGLSTQRGGSRSVGFGMAIFIVFLYWVFYHSMFVVGKNGGLPPMLASFLADIVGAVVGIVLAVRASR